MQLALQTQVAVAQLAQVGVLMHEYLLAHFGARSRVQSSKGLWAITDACQRHGGNPRVVKPQGAKGYAMVTGTTDLKRERREAGDGPAQVAKRPGSLPVVADEEDPAIKHARMLGAWSARTIFLIEVVYVGVFVAGFASIRNTSDPLPDPYLAIAEILILVMAPIMVCLMLAIHQCAPKQAKPFTQVALGWMLAAAAVTTVVHFVQLTVARHLDPATFPGYAGIFGWQWPSTFYAIDIVAWDVFFGLALLFAVPAFARRGDAALVRRGLILGGSLCLIGLVGPFANVIALRTIGIVGYTVVFGLTCLPLSRTFNTGTGEANSGAA